jgi:predicted ribosomally synthesized peptide with SipW-like signal peptide
MPPRLLRALICVLALGAAASLTLGGTVSAYTDTETTASNAFTAAADWTAPTTAAAPIGRSTAYETGTIAHSTTYYVYANVSDTGNPAAGVATVTANVSSITSGSTAVALVAGTYSAEGTAYGYRSASLTAPAGLTAGSHTYTITSTDRSANAATQSFTTTVDNTAPAAVDVQSTNVSGGVVGRFDLGDTFTLTYSGTMDPYSILPAWTGASTHVQVALVDGGGTASDYVVIYNTDASPSQLPLGTIYLTSPNYLKTGTGDYLTYGATGSATPSTMTRTGASISITLGTTSGTSSTNTTAAHMTWTPSTSALDIAGNASTAAAATQTGTVRVNF